MSPTGASAAAAAAAAAINPFNLPAKFWIVINVNGVAFVDQETKEVRYKRKNTNARVCMHAFMHTQYTHSF